MELIEEMQVNKTIDSAFEYLAFLPDSVHVGKKLEMQLLQLVYHLKWGNRIPIHNSDFEG